MCLEDRDHVPEIDADTGKTVGLSDRRGNKLSITDEGIESNRGRGVVFTRDQRGRITFITDPRGNTTASSNTR